MSLQGCTRLSSTMITLLLMILYWIFFADFLNIFAILVSAQSANPGTSVSTKFSAECTSNLEIGGIVKDCASEVGAQQWKEKYGREADDYFNADLLSELADGVTANRWGVAKIFQFLLVAMSVLFGLLSAAVLGCVFAVMVFLKTGKKYQLEIKMPSRLEALDILLKQVSLTNPLGHNYCQYHSSCKEEPSTPDLSFAYHTPASSSFGSCCSAVDEYVVSPEVDAALARLLDTALKYEVLPWYQQLVVDTRPALDEIRSVSWHVLKRLAALCRRLDGVAFLTGGAAACLTRHLERVRQAQQLGERAGDRGVFHLLPQLSSPERERNFLRRLSDFLLLHTLPDRCSRCGPLRTLLTEVLACKFLEVFVDKVCSPDWINQNIVQYLTPLTIKQKQLQQLPQQQLPQQLDRHQQLHLKSASKTSRQTGSEVSPQFPAGGNYQQFVAMLHGDEYDAPLVWDDQEWSIDQLISVIQDSTDEERLENVRHALHLELQHCTSAVLTSGRLVSGLTRARAECERRLLALKAGLTDPEFTPASFSSVLESPFCRRYLNRYLLSLQSRSQEGRSSLCKEEPVGAVDGTDTASVGVPEGASDSIVKESSVNQENIIVCGQTGDSGEGLADAIDGNVESATSSNSCIVVNANRISSSGVSALGLYCSLLELLAAPSRLHLVLRSQIYHTYFSKTCTRPVPIDEVVQQHIWQLVLAGTSKVGGATTGKEGASNACAPLIGCLAGAVEEVGQFLQTRYSAGFLHSSHYSAMLAEATEIGQSITTCQDSVSKFPLCLQQQLQHAKCTHAFHQERYLYKSWALSSLPQTEQSVIEDCQQDVADSEKCTRQYETHLHTLQVWTDNLGKWRVHVQGVEFAEEKDNPDVILLVSLDEDSPLPSCLQASMSQCTASSPLPTPKSPLHTRRSPQLPRHPLPPSHPQIIPQQRQKQEAAALNAVRTSLASSMLHSTLSAISSAASISDSRYSPSRNDEGLCFSSTVTTQATNSDSLKNAKSKSLSFEKEHSTLAKGAALKKSSSSLDKLPYPPVKSNSLIEKQSAGLSRSKGGSLEKSCDSRKPKSSTGSLERLFENFSKPTSYGSSSSGDSTFSSSSYCTTTAGGGVDLCPGGQAGGDGPDGAAEVFLSAQDMDGWVVVRKLSHFAELHKKLCQHWPNLKSRDVPCLPAKSLFSSKSSVVDRACTERLRASTQRYLSALTWDALDPGPARSVLFFELVCPTSHLLLRPHPPSLPPTAKKTKFSITSFFKGHEGRGDSDEDEGCPSSISITEPLSRRLAPLTDSSVVPSAATMSAGGGASVSVASAAAGVVSKTASSTASIAVQIFGNKLGGSGEEGVMVDTVDDGGATSTTGGSSGVGEGTNMMDIGMVSESGTAMAGKKFTSTAVTPASDKTDSFFYARSTAVAGAANAGLSSFGAKDLESSSASATAAAAAAATAGVGTSDAVAEHLFALLEELCELRGTGKLLRKGLVSFVQMTYGKSITRDVRETASALLTQEMLVRYIRSLEETVWPQEQCGQQQQQQNESSATHYQRTQKQINDTRQEAGAAVLHTLPEYLGRLVGDKNAGNGAHRLFTTLQHHALNKNLFYNILEELLQEVFPELREKMDRLTR